MALLHKERVHKHDAFSGSISNQRTGGHSVCSGKQKENLGIF